MKSVFWSPDVTDLQVLGLEQGDLDRQSVMWLVSATIATLIINIAWWHLQATMSIGLLLVSGLLITWSWWQPRQRIKARAAQIRADMDLAVAVFLDLVNVLLAGGAGVETAMLAAASSGDGWAFQQIRLALARAQSARRGYWDELRELGQAIGVDSLVEVSHSVQLAGDHGAKVRASLASKSRALRGRNLARIEHDAERRTEQMGLPLVVMFIGFLVLVGYPAFAGTVGAL